MVAIASLWAVMLVPFALLSAMPGWKTLALAYSGVVGVVLWLVLELPGTAEAGAVLILLMTLIGAGGVAGLVTGSARIVLRQRGATWHVRSLALAIGALSTPVLWVLVSPAILS